MSPTTFRGRTYIHDNGTEAPVQRAEWDEDGIGVLVTLAGRQYHQRDEADTYAALDELTDNGWTSFVTAAFV
jgi:hypothetical protein